eukprot:CAMPEP_0185903736 /NCGR_PEP_ID=MMETSP0196C-20130402/3023_1 /TAXON_ID=2932 /ORGANISM="Alexandrium fundyense, Strain CCMP1719" /LENGTH=48 /DNA_ID= /DNA_START= /DNA_END= /DNA_ORIENTATION=
MALEYAARGDLGAAMVTLEEEADNLPAGVLASGLFMIHDAVRCRQHQG